MWYMLAQKEIWQRQILNVEGNSLIITMRFMLILGTQLNNQERNQFRLGSDLVDLVMNLLIVLMGNVLIDRR